MKYSEAGKGSVARKTNKQKFDESFDRIFRNKEEVETDEEWDEIRADIIGQNGNSGEHYSE